MNLRAEIIRHLAAHVASNFAHVEDSAADLAAYIARNEPLEIRTRGGMGSELITPVNLGDIEREVFSADALTVAKAFDYDAERIGATSASHLLYTARPHPLI